MQLIDAMYPNRSYTAPASAYTTERIVVAAGGRAGGYHGAERNVSRDD